MTISNNPNNHFSGFWKSQYLPLIFLFWSILNDIQNVNWGESVKESKITVEDRTGLLPTQSELALFSKELALVAMSDDISKIQLPMNRKDWSWWLVWKTLPTQVVDVAHEIIADTPIRIYKTKIQGEWVITDRNGNQIIYKLDQELPIGDGIAKQLNLPNKVINPHLSLDKIRQIKDQINVLYWFEWKTTRRDIKFLQEIKNKVVHYHFFIYVTDGIRDGYLKISSKAEIVDPWI